VHDASSRYSPSFCDGIKLLALSRMEQFLMRGPDVLPEDNEWPKAFIAGIELKSTL